MKEEVAKMNLYSNALMVLTTIHHIYGAIIYDTPWRLHVLLLSIPVIIVTLILSWFLKADRKWNRLLYAANVLIVLIFSVILIGSYEGVYNHVFKNIAYFSGTSKSVLDQLFDPSKYVLPNDFVFEFTGIMQGIVFVPLTMRFLTVSKIFRKKAA